MTPNDCACDDEQYNGPLSLAELVQIRRYMGYTALGGINSGEQSWRFFQVYGFNEWRLQNMAPDEYEQIRRHLGDCKRLESEVYGSSANLDTDQAAVWKHNKTETAERIGLYRWARQQLCEFMGIPPGPGLIGRTNAIVI